ncbi:hypothetical protein D9V41_14105 [Aeromicrobium phragmitis]|uniref:WXG100 family type VII secretion target n=1 Tax=Aeromicrobium phragmitis TaxID=2478914 RepID=A0A3L8PI13_9ACTN|nr:WXG100 family type VII secretion target [Aeromicrobium phragmitis]RLV54947.1 hypothetical protein D9V41_14105 [Aeromicrobium phragmitis]
MTGSGHQRDERAAVGLEHTRVIERRLAELEAELTRLRAQWNGTATEAYQAAQEQWREAVRDLHELLSPRRDEEPAPPPRERPDPPSSESPRRSSPRWA